MLAGLGGSLLRAARGHRAGPVPERVCEGLIAAARQAGLPYQDYRLPRDLQATPLLGGLTGEQVASQIVEVLHADDPARPPRAGPPTSWSLRKVIRTLAAPGSAASGEVTMAQVHDALVAHWRARRRLPAR